MLRDYKPKAIATCLADQTGQGAVFIGDSTVREVFWATARKLNSTAAKAQESRTDKHKDIVFQSGESTVSFIWDPMLKSTQLQHYVKASRDSARGAEHVDLSGSRALVIVGGGLWFAAEARNPIEDFKHAMDKVALPSDDTNHHEVAEPGTNKVLFMPVQPPLYDSLDAEHKAKLHKADIDAMNKYMRELPGVYDAVSLYTSPSPRDGLLSRMPSSA